MRLDSSPSPFQITKTKKNESKWANKEAPLSPSHATNGIHAENNHVLGHHH
jgi:hypothetical protein